MRSLRKYHFEIVRSINPRKCPDWNTKKNNKYRLYRTANLFWKLVRDTRVQLHSARFIVIFFHFFFCLRPPVWVFRSFIMFYERFVILFRGNTVVRTVCRYWNFVIFPSLAAYCRCISKIARLFVDMFFFFSFFPHNACPPYSQRLYRNRKKTGGGGLRRGE